MAYVIDQVDLLGYLASDARVRGPFTGTLAVHLSEAVVHYLHETLSARAGQPLTLAFWEPGYYLVVRGRASVRRRLAVGAQCSLGVPSVTGGPHGPQHQ